MGSRTFDGVRFQAYTDDHGPPHVHGFYGGIEVVVELVMGETRLADRDDAVRPLSGKRSDVQHVLKVATKNADKLVGLWRIARG